MGSGMRQKGLKSGFFSTGLVSSSFLPKPQILKNGLSKKVAGDESHFPPPQIETLEAALR
jgi:hypothetical protein